MPRPAVLARVDEDEPTFRCGAALPGVILWPARILGVVGGLFTAVMLGGVLVPLARDGSTRVDLFGAQRTATLDAPGPLLAYCGIALLLGGLFVGWALLLEREARKGPPVWRATARGLVRIRGDEVRTLPWPSFRGVTCWRTARTRGHVLLWKDRLRHGAPWVRAEEGRVFVPSRALWLADVERPEVVAAILRAHLPAR